MAKVTIKAPEVKPHVWNSPQYVLRVMALAAVFSSSAVFGDSGNRGCVAVSRSGVIETRDSHVATTSAGIVNTASGLGVLIFIR